MEIFIGSSIGGGMIQQKTTCHHIRCAPILAHKRKPGRCGPVQFAGVGAPTITFQRGTAASIMVAIWEDGATESPRSAVTMRAPRHRHNATGHMPAMRKAAMFSGCLCGRPEDSQLRAAGKAD